MFGQKNGRLPSCPFSNVTNMIISSWFNFILSRFFGDCLPIIPLFGVLLIEYGLSLSQISLVLFVLAASVMIFEIPTGVLADKMPPKYAVVISRLLKFCAFLIILLFPNLIGVLCGVFVWGLSSAFDSGAFQSYLYQFVNRVGDSTDFNKLYAQTSTASMVGLLVSAAIATQVSFIGLYGLQIIGIVFLGLSVLSVLLYPSVVQAVPEENEQIIANSLHIKSKLLHYILRNRALFILLCIGVMAGSVKGSLDEYVSLMLLDKGVSIALIGYALFGLELMKSFGGFITQWITATICLQKIILISMGAGFILIGIGNVYVALSVFAVILLMDSILWIQNDISIQHQSNDSNRATISSIKNFLMELISASLFLAAWLLGGSLIVSQFYVIGGLILLFTSIILILIRVKIS